MGEEIALPRMRTQTHPGITQSLYYHHRRMNVPAKISGWLNRQQGREGGSRSRPPPVLYNFNHEIHIHTLLLLLFIFLEPGQEAEQLFFCDDAPCKKRKGRRKRREMINTSVFPVRPFFKGKNNNASDNERRSVFPHNGHLNF